jgi:hypothetical protein
VTNLSDLITAWKQVYVIMIVPALPADGSEEEVEESVIDTYIDTALADTETEEPLPILTLASTNTGYRALS